MAVEVIANTLGLDMFRVDTSSEVSRWVGETKELEKSDGQKVALPSFCLTKPTSLARGDVKQAQIVLPIKKSPLASTP